MSRAQRDNAHSATERSGPRLPAFAPLILFPSFLLYLAGALFRGTKPEDQGVERGAGEGVKAKRQSQPLYQAAGFEGQCEDEREGEGETSRRHDFGDGVM